jgi:hypothetical protein
MFCFKIDRQLAGGLSNDLQMVDNPGLHQFIGVENFPAFPGIFLNALNGLENIL